MFAVKLRPAPIPIRRAVHADAACSLVGVHNRAKLWPLTPIAKPRVVDPTRPALGPSSGSPLMNQSHEDHTDSDRADNPGDDDDPLKSGHINKIQIQPYGSIVQERGSRSTQCSSRVPALLIRRADDLDKISYPFAVPCLQAILVTLLVSTMFA